MENKEELELTWCPQVFGATFLFIVLSSNCFYSGVFPLRVSWQAVWIPSQSLSPHSLLVLWQKRQDVCVFGEFERRHKKMCKTASSEPQEYVKVKNYKIFFFLNIYRRWREFHWDRGWVRSHTTTTSTRDLKLPAQGPHLHHEHPTFANHNSILPLNLIHKTFPIIKWVSELSTNEKFYFF